MSNYEYGLLIMGLVATLRARAPRLDGWPVILLACAISIAVAAAVATSLQDAVQRALVIAGTATGAAAAVGYGATKLGNAMSPQSSVHVDAISAPVSVTQREGETPISVGTRGVS